MKRETEFIKKSWPQRKAKILDAAAVTVVRAAFGYILLTPETKIAVTAISRTNPDFRLINKHSRRYNLFE